MVSVMFDLDRFKYVNDTLGPVPATGYCSPSRAISEILRDGDTIARVAATSSRSYCLK
jgi:GGDEF domain-containing protein